MVDVMELPTEEADEATAGVDAGLKLPELTPEKIKNQSCKQLQTQRKVLNASELLKG